MFVKCFLLLQNSNPRTEVDKDLCIVISSFVEIWWLKSYTSEKHLFRTTWAWPVSWHDKGHWHTALSFQVVTFVCPFSRAQESQIVNCHQVTAEYSDHRLKRAHCLFVPFPGPSHWSLTLSVWRVSHLSSSGPCRSQTFPLLKCCSPKYIWNRSALLNKHV